MISTGNVALDNTVLLLDPMDFHFKMPGGISYRITNFISTSRIPMVDFPHRKPLNHDQDSFRNDEDTSHFEGTQASK